MHDSATSTKQNTVSPASVTAESLPPVGEQPQQDLYLDGLKHLPVQRKLAIGSVDDPLEKEADTMADRVMRMPEQNVIQRKCAACESEEKLQCKVEKDELFAQAKFITGASFIQRKCTECESKDRERLQRKPVSKAITPFIQTKGNEDSSVSNSLSSSIQNSRGNGSSLDSNTHSFMETRFGLDFSAVKIHTGSEAIQMNKELNSQAFTVGNDVYFNEGKYQPNAAEGKHLLAHELTHVAQQNPNIAKKEKRPQSDTKNRGEKSNLSFTQENIVQCSKSFVPVTGNDGTLIHSTVLPLFKDANTDLFIETKVPGGNKTGVNLGSYGIADFYKAEPTQGKSRTIGLNFKDENPSFLTKDKKLDFGGGSYNHNKDSAPQGTTRSPKIKKIDSAPTGIQLGDLKPGGSAEVILGRGQLSNYIKGIENTAKKTTSYLTGNPGETDGAKSWNVGVTKMSSLTIPSKLSYPGVGIARNRLAVYDVTGKVVPDSGLVGSLFVYKDNEPGIWSYEWIPENIPSSTGSGKVNQVLNRLNTDVIPPLISAGATSISPKRFNNIPPKTLHSKKSNTAHIQRKEEKFKDEDWKKKSYTPWKNDAENFLTDKSEVQKVQVAEALVDLNDRTGSKVPVPGEVTERGKGLAKIKHWKKFGGIYGWLREKFDFVFVKVHGFAKNIKEKVQKVAKRVGSTSFGSWVKAAAKVVFKIFKMVGAWVVGQVLDKLVDSLKEGIFSNIKKLIDMVTPDDAKAKIQEFEELKEKYQLIIEAKEDELIKRFFGDKLEFFEKLEKFEAIADTLSSIATLVEWGVRLLACASPPAVGCLWNLAISALQAAFAWLMQTCWFTKKVYEPVISNVDLVRNFPAEVAAKIVTTANEYIPVPMGFDPLFAPIAINTGEFKLDCSESGDGPGKLTPERQAIIKLVEEIGADKFNALLELTLKRGAGPWVLLTAERLAELKEALNEVNTEDLKSAANDKTKSPPEPLDKFLKDIKTYTAGEKKLIKESADSKKTKEAAEAAKKAGGTGGNMEPDISQNPIYGKPDKLDGRITGILYGCVIDGSHLDVGKSYPDPIDIYLGVYFNKDNKLYKLIINNVTVKIGVVEKDLIEVINQKDFYAKYDDTKLIFFPKDKVLKIATDKILYMGN